ncbi:hypothetical protein EV361DRAFT_949371 [Lentinula raphanica]|nr:hypothetical protein EV361DRAFT_949371 [Lentinula raphanica]
MYISRWPIYLPFLAAIPASVLGIPINHPATYHGSWVEADYNFQTDISFRNMLDHSETATASYTPISEENSYRIADLATHIVTLAHHKFRRHSKIRVSETPKVIPETNVYRFTVTGGPVCGEEGCDGEITLRDGGEAAEIGDSAVLYRDRIKSDESYSDGDAKLVVISIGAGEINGRMEYSKGLYHRTQSI